MKKLVVLEASQKQNYIFRTNELAENVGASMIIRYITEELPDQFLDPDLKREETVFRGGGKSVFEFDASDDGNRARRFCRELSERVLTDYPGIELFMATNEYNEQKDDIASKIDELYGKLEKKKASREAYFRFYGPGVAALCTDTGEPASGFNRYRPEKSDVPMSAESLGKMKAAIEKRAYTDEQGHSFQMSGQDAFFHEFLPDPEKYRFANEFEELGGTQGVKSYIAVIAADGNRMGNKIKKFRSEFKKSSKKLSPLDRNQKYKEEFASLSRTLDDNYRDAVKETIRFTADHLEEMEKDFGLNVSHDGGRTVLPIRPLIVSGDDICILCDARISISFTEYMLKNIDGRQITSSIVKKPMPMHACAGIAMVRSHYPFFRAHELAEQLCNNAKSVLPADEKSADAGDESVLDFHIVQGELEGSLGEIRKEKYRNGRLTNKPYYICALNKNLPSPSGKAKKGSGGTDVPIRKNSLPYFKERMDELKGTIARSALKAYREALAAGRQQTETFINHKRLQDKLKIEDIFDGAGEEEHCVDFDVIEMMDIYHPIEAAGSEHTAQKEDSEGGE